MYSYLLFFLCSEIKKFLNQLKNKENYTKQVESFKKWYIYKISYSFQVPQP